MTIEKSPCTKISENASFYSVISKRERTSTHTYVQGTRKLKCPARIEIREYIFLSFPLLWSHLNYLVIILD